MFVDLFERRDDRSTSAVFTVTMTSLTLFTAATMLLSPLLARLFVIHEHGPDRDAQLHGALTRLLGDTALRDRLARAAADIQRRQGLRRAADVIESAAGS